MAAALSVKESRVVKVSEVE